MLRLGVAVVGLSLFALLAKAAPMNSCDENAFPPCADLAKAPVKFSNNAPLGFETPRNGGTIFNIFSVTSKVDTRKPFALLEIQSPDLLNMENVAPARAQKSLELANSVRQRAIAVIKGHIQPAFFSSEQRVLVKRLETLKIFEGDVDDKLCSRDVPSGMPNVGYEPAAHTLIVCPAALNLSEPQLIQAIGHELGHVVNPCVTAGTLYEVDKDEASFEKFKDCDPTLVPDGESYNDETIAVRRMLTSETPYAIGVPSNTYFHTLETCGLIHPATKDSTLAHSSMFSKTMSCLKRTYEREYQSDLFQNTTAIMKRDHISEERAEAKAGRETPFACQVEANEAFADSFSSKILGEMSTSWSPSEMKSSFLTTLGFACFEKRAGAHAQDGYPSASRRLQTVMSDDRIATRLQCAPAKNPSVCPLSIDYSNPADPVRKAGSRSHHSTPKPSAHAVH